MMERNLDVGTNIGFGGSNIIARILQYAAMQENKRLDDKCLSVALRLRYMPMQERYEGQVESFFLNKFEMPESNKSNFIPTEIGELCEFFRSSGDALTMDEEKLIKEIDGLIKRTPKEHAPYENAYTIPDFGSGSITFHCGTAEQEGKPSVTLNRLQVLFCPVREKFDAKYNQIPLCDDARSIFIPNGLLHTSPQEVQKGLIINMAQLLSSPKGQSPQPKKTPFPFLQKFLRKGTSKPLIGT